MNHKKLIEYCLTHSDTYEDYPFGEEWAVIRHKSNKKSFALIYEREGRLCINLKCEPMKADFLRSVKSGVVPAYHMNKVHWNTIYINTDVTKEELYDMIDHSFSITAPKLRGKKA